MMSCLCKDDFTKKIVSFLKQNPNPSDKVVHNWAEENNVDVHKLESHIYKLATNMAFLAFGGKFGKSDMDIKDFNESEVKKGIAVELEHTSKVIDAKKITLDHLVESKHYYKGLALLEKYLEKHDKDFDENLLKKQMGL